MPTCSINYDNKSKGIFYSGKSITGIIVFDNEKSRKVYYISLTFEGYAKSKWNTGNGTNNTDFYRGRQNYISQKKYLISNEVKGKQMELPKGQHRYRFSFDIPSTFPTSIERCRDELGFGSTCGVRGYIRYLLTLKATRSRKPDIKYEFPLTIIKNYDLNFVSPRYRVPITVKNTKNFTLSSKPLHMMVDAPVTAFVCGQKAKFLVSYNNESSIDVLQTKVQLVRIIFYNSDEPKRKTKIGNEGILMKVFEGVPGKTSKNVEVILHIPSIPPSSDGACRVMVISYEIHITAVFGGLHSDQTLKIPVVIGTVPFLSSDLLPPLPIDFDEAPEYPSASAPPSLLIPSTSSGTSQTPNIRSVFNRDSIGWNLGPSTSTAFIERPSAPPVPTTPEDYNMPPPTYMEAIAGIPMENNENTQNSIATERGDISFTPSYPVYNFDQEENLPPKYSAKYR